MNPDEVDPQATQFAITNLNIPDRLDLRDFDDRKQGDETKRLHLEGIVRWTVRIVVGLLLVGIVFGAIEAYSIWRNTISAASVSERLSVALGSKVTIEGTEVSLSPDPRLVVRKIRIADRVAIDEVSIGLGIQGLSEIMRGKGVHWGEAVVHSAHITPDQGNALLQLLPRLGKALPRGVTVLRFERLELDGQTWLKGAASLSTSRDSDGNFSLAILQQQLNKGTMRLQLAPASGAPEPAAAAQAGTPGNAPTSTAAGTAASPAPATTEHSATVPSVRFQLEAKNWILPFGAKFPLEDVIALGQIDADHLEVSEYSIAGPFGLVQGRLLASRGAHAWTLDGTSGTDGMDLEALIHMVSPLSDEDKDKEKIPPTMIQGTAAFAGRFEGKGDGLEEAFARASFSAPVVVRWAVLNGVDLGYVAIHPRTTGGTGGGMTRFTSMEANVNVAGGKVRISEIHGRAGALSTSGIAVLAPDLSLDGSVRVDLGVVRVQAPIRVDIHGTILKPLYGR
jgi:hypothetical protein